MSRLIFDIETSGYPLETFDDVQREYLLKYTETEKEKENEIRKLNLWPFTAQIVAIGMLNIDTLAGRVYYQSNQKESWKDESGKVEFISGDERFLLENFWETINKYDKFITFNGRGFDCPFIMLRSAVLGVKPTRNLMPYRYDSKIHCDLLEQFTFYGTIRKFNLDFYCKAFGIDSPKSHGITGLDINDLFAQNKYREIAEYCLWDLKATLELYKKWEEYLNIK